MYLDVRMPWWSEGRLGQAYNRAMETVEDWVVFVDQDVLMVNPHWCEMVEGVIETLGHRAGWITCVTNRIGCVWQRRGGVYNGDDIEVHARIAKDRMKTCSGEVIRVHTPPWFSGHFLITHKKAWKDAGKFKDGMFVDKQYGQGLHEAGYDQYVMLGLYAYHIYDKKKDWWGEDHKEFKNRDRVEMPWNERSWRTKIVGRLVERWL